MTGDRERERRALTLRPTSSVYEVGFGKPPVETRFKPGRSGNPRGRPKGSRNRPKPPALNAERLKAIVLEEAYRIISVNDGNRQVSIPMAQAVVRSLAVNAAKGNQRAQRLFTELLASIERENNRLHNELLETAITYKVEWERELERRRILGIEGREPLPHPDHIVLDMQTGQVRIIGPMTKEEKAEWEMFRQRKDECDEEIRYLVRRLANDPDNQELRKELEQERRIRELIAKVIPD